MREARLIERKKPTVLARGGSAFVRRRPLSFNTDVAKDPLAAIDFDDQTPIEKQTGEALDAVTSAFREAEKRMFAERGTNDNAYYRVLVFCDEAQADAFMTAVGQLANDIYCDGRKVCDRLGIALPPDSWNLNRRTNTPNRRLAALARPIVRKRDHGEASSQEVHQEDLKEGQQGQGQGVQEGSGEQRVTS